VRFVAVIAALLALAAPAAAATPSPAALLDRYRPYLSLSPDERFLPDSVENFLSVSTLQLRSGSAWTDAPAETLPTADPAGCTSTPDTPCWRLDVRPCRADTGLSSLECYVDLRGGGVTYGRYLRTPKRIVLQYWFFYAYDFWSAHFPPDEFVWRSHEGDWEQATVVLARSGRPLYAAYSQHCNGQRSLWRHVRKLQRTHPLVYVALGSHANYFRPGVHRHDRACYPRIALAIFDQNRVVPVDYVGTGDIFSLPIVRVTPTTPAWMAFPGAWGERGFFHAPDIGTVAYGYGPAGPAFHDSWRDPLRTIARWKLTP
jgi:hypothetical protein